MTTDDVIKRIIMLLILLFVFNSLPHNSTYFFVNQIYYLSYLVIIISVILLSATQVEALKHFIPENVLETVIWVVVFVTTIGSLIIWLFSPFP